MTQRQETITTCDGQHDHEADAHTIQLAVRLNGDPGFTMVEVDYCPVHEAPLVDLVNEMVAQGRPFYAPGLRKAKANGQATQKPTRAKRIKRVTVESHACPAEGCDRTFATANGLAIHTGRKHPELATTAA